MNEKKTYYAFISYKHKEEQWAKWLQKKLESYKFPTTLNGREDLPKQIFPTCRDVTDFTAGRKLPEEINEKLRDSQWLIVICSPSSAQSPWVCKEAQTFIDLGRADRIIPLIIDGTPFSKDENTECYPESLRKLTGQQEILAANINDMGRDAAFIKVIARMFNLSFDGLWQRREREIRRKKNWIIAAIIAFVLGVLSVTATILIQNKHLRQTNSRAAAAMAEKLIEEGDSYTARKVATAALELAYTPEAEAALRHAYKHENALLRCILGNLYTHNLLQFSPNGEKIVSACLKNIYIWDVHTGQCIDTLKGHTQGVNSVFFSFDGKKIVSASSDSTIRIWDISSGICMNTLLGHKKPVISATFSYDGKKIVSISKDNTIRIWNASTGLCLDTLNVTYMGPYWLREAISLHSAKFSHDGQKIVSTSWDGTIRIWDVITGECIDTLIDRHPQLYSADFSSDGKKIVSQTCSGIVYIWEIEKKQILDSLEGIYFVTSCHDRNGFIFASKEGYIYHWNENTGLCSDSIKVPRGRVSSFHPDTKRMISNVSDTINIWNFDSTHHVKMLRGHNTKLTISSAAYNSSDGNKIISSSYDGTIRIWDAVSGRCIDSIVARYGDWIEYAEFSPDGSKIVSGSYSGQLCLLDALSGDTIWTTSESLGTSPKPTFSPDGKRIVTACRNKNILIWDADSGKCIDSLIGHTHWVGAAKFSPNGRKIVSSGDTTTRIWDAITGDCIDTIKGSFGDCSFSPKGDIIIAYGYSTIHLWNAKTKKRLITIRGEKQISSVSFSPDEKQIVSATWNGIIRIWDVNSGKCLFTQKEKAGRGKYLVAFSPDGEKILSTTPNGIIKIWDFPSLKELTDETSERFKDNPLTPEERRAYYLE